MHLTPVSAIIALKEMSARKIDKENKEAVNKFKEESMFRYYRETSNFIRR